MRCSDCKYYHGGFAYNRCDISGDEYFKTQDDCTLVNDDGSVNFDDPYFREQEIYEQDMNVWDMENTGEGGEL